MRPSAEREAGFTTVDEYVAEIVSQDLVDDFVVETPNLDHLFTPDRLAEIDKAQEQIKAGNFYTAQQVREHFKRKRAEWKKRNPSA